MSKIRKKIERWFESFSLFLCRYRWWVLVVMTVLVGGMGSQLPRITFDTSNEGFLHPNDPTLTTYNEFRRRFGRDDLIIIAIEPKDIFNQTFLKKLKNFHHDLETQVPFIEDIYSMVNARNTRGKGDVLIVGDLLEQWPKDHADLEDLRNRIMSNPLYLNRLISEDGQLTTIAVKTNAYSSKHIGIEPSTDFDKEEALTMSNDVMDAMEEFENETESLIKPTFLTDKELSEVVAQVKKTAAKYRTSDFDLYIAGAPVVSNAVKQFQMRDQKVFMRLIVLTIGLCLFIMFRRLSAVVLPLIVVVCALVSTLGLMTIFKIPLKPPTAVLPSFLMAAGVAYAVHILTIFYRHLAETGKKNDAIAFAMGHSGLAIVLTALTTAAGLASFSAAKVAPIAELGIFASVGVLLALLYTIVMLPALLAVVPIRAKDRKNMNSRSTTMDRFLLWVGNFSTNHSRSIVWASVLLIIISLIFASQLRFSHDVLKWLPESAEVRKATEKIDNALKGSVAVEVIIDTGQVNGLYDVDTLNKIEYLTHEIEKIKEGDLFVGKATSVVDILKEIHQALNENRPEYYVVPQDPALVPQEFLLFENSGSDDLEDVVDPKFQRARFTIKVPWLDAVRYVDLLKDLTEHFDRVFGSSVQTSITGMMTIMFTTVVSAIHSAAESYIIAGLVITVMVILLIGSIRIGLLAMLPNILAILLVMGLMKIFNFPFNLFTMLIGSIALGLAVDNTIHFMHNFRRYFGSMGDVPRAVRETLLTSGRALLVTTVVLSIAFFIYMFASMNNLFHFGLLTGVTIILALSANFFLTPALLTMVYRHKRSV